MEKIFNKEYWKFKLYSICAVSLLVFIPLYYHHYFGDKKNVDIIICCDCCKMEN